MHRQHPITQLFVAPARRVEIGERRIAPAVGGADRGLVLADDAEIDLTALDLRQRVRFALRLALRRFAPRLGAGLKPAASRRASAPASG